MQPIFLGFSPENDHGLERMGYRRDSSKVLKFPLSN